ncbi:hypothetical protein LUZ63_011288 [Rhynchospora breviuscula]|uniref:Uncharacterized protein n=1 Tax=Rhynchospora breviuscula TaxID=2022672 RepID=A0A9Q0HQV7_9POAL|nr:hypothetical protein LUZ63_011288 [Rhynchospora breviuscula]
MAETAVLAPLGWVVSPLLKTLVDKARELLGTSLDEKIKKLEATALPRLSLAIEKAEMSPNKDQLQDWLQRLKGAYYDAEEAIDLLEYQILKQKVKANRKIRISLPFVHRFVQKIVLMGCIDKLIEIANEAKDFREVLEARDIASTSNPDRQINSQSAGTVFGRENDIKELASLLTGEHLRKNSEPGPSSTTVIPIIIAITGRSGVGKTTLAWSVHQYMEEQNSKQKKTSEQNCFDLLFWVDAPRKFKAADLVLKMIQKKKAKDGVLHEANYDATNVELVTLLEQLKAMLGSDVKFLLVIDDFWCDDEGDRKQWEAFINGLIGWLQAGSKILLTTQNVGAVKQARLPDVPEIKAYHLQELKEGAIFELFMHHAKLSTDLLSIQRKEFEISGRKIAVKLKGDPGAAKLVGHQLSTELDLSRWQVIEEKDWSRDENNMKARIWSYQQLSVYLQRCFSFCCLFPKGFGFSVQLLINLWMAEGFIKPTKREDRMEDIGKNYLNELVHRFFLEKYVHQGNIYYKLHDLFHDLAELVQGDHFLRIDDTDPINVPPHELLSSQTENIRHISLPASMIIECKDKICLAKNLCTLICTENNCNIPKKVLQNILKK